MTLLDIAQGMRGNLRDGYSPLQAGAASEDSSVRFGTAVSDSEGGYVTIRMDGAPQEGDSDYDENGDYTFTVPCDSPISEGSRVSYISAEGRGKAVSVATLAQIAEGADAIATATNQHFWADGNGVHVSTDEADPAGDQNIVMNANGVLLREQSANLAAFTPSAVAFYDGEGNDPENITASFGSTGAVVGKEGMWQTAMTSGSFAMVRGGITAAELYGATELDEWVSDAINVIWDQDISGSTWYSEFDVDPGTVSADLPIIAQWLFEAPVGMLYSFLIPNTSDAGNAYNSGRVRWEIAGSDVGKDTATVTVSGGGYSFTATAQLDSIATFDISGGTVLAKRLSGPGMSEPLRVGGGVRFVTGEDAFYVNAISSQHSPGVQIVSDEVEVDATAIIRSTNITSGTAPQSDTTGEGVLRFHDAADNFIGSLQPRFFASGNQTMQLYAVRSVGGTPVYNTLQIGVNASGSRTVSVSDPAVWRTALGISGSTSRTVFYGTCSTAAAAQAKEVTADGFAATDLKAGTVLFVKFTNAQTYNGAPTLNVNSTGAVNIKRIGTTNAGRYEWEAGEVVCLVHDGTYWLITDGGIATTTYYGYTKLSSSTTSTSAAMAATPAAVKAAYDLANGKQDPITYATNAQVIGMFS